MVRNLSDREVEIADVTLKGAARAEIVEADRERFRLQPTEDRELAARILDPSLGPATAPVVRVELASGKVITRSATPPVPLQQQDLALGSTRRGVGKLQGRS